MMRTLVLALVAFEVLNGLSGVYLAARRRLIRYDAGNAAAQAVVSTVRIVALLWLIGRVL